MASKSKRTSNRNGDGKSAPIVLDQAVNIPLDKLVLSDANVRTVGVDDTAAMAAFAESIARRSLLQSLMVRPVLDDGGEPTGVYEVPGGGRRLRALQFLAAKKRLAHDAPIPCIVKTTGLAEEDSLAENNDREQLHPLDEFRAFAALRDKGQGDEDIAAAFRVTPAFVRQRMRLASASPILLQAYADDALTLEQLIAFCITTDHARQEQVLDTISKRSPSARDVWQIRQLLTETTVEATDPRAKFIGLDTYIQAGGSILRDLFEDDNGGWLQDPALLNRLVDEKLAVIRDALLAKGWKWVEAAADIPFNAKQGLRRLIPTGKALSKKDQKRLDALRTEHDGIIDSHNEADLPDDLKAKLATITADIVDLETRPAKYAREDIVIGGVFVELDEDGHPSVDYGFVRPEHEPDAARDAAGEGADTEASIGDDVEEETEGDDTPKQLSERLVQDLTSYRTVGLRNALAQDFDTAFVAVLHAMCLGIFYHHSGATCLQVTVSDSFPADAPGLPDFAAAKTTDDRHKSWLARIPRDRNQLWQVLLGMSHPDRQMLFAHCAGHTVNAVSQKFMRKDGALGHADQLARVLGLDMVKAGWTTTIDTYLGRVTKAHILDAVREAKDEATVQLLDHLKKPEMAKEAQRLLAATGWLPRLLRMPDEATAVPQASEDDADDLPDFLDQDQEGSRHASV